MTKKFTRTIEDFVCGHCGNTVIGNGYTNHCPKCLWSKHVDIHPGDRKETCNGLMPPVGALQKRGEYYVLHQCEKCGFERQQKFEKNDDFDMLLALTRNSL